VLGDGVFATTLLPLSTEGLNIIDMKMLSAIQRYADLNLNYSPLSPQHATTIPSHSQTGVFRALKRLKYEPHMEVKIKGLTVDLIIEVAGHPLIVEFDGRASRHYFFKRNNL
jgi:hypothetical protein